MRRVERATYGICPPAWRPRTPARVAWNSSPQSKTAAIRLHGRSFITGIQLASCRQSGTRERRRSRRNGTNWRIGSRLCRGSGLAGSMPGGAHSVEEEPRSWRYGETAASPVWARSPGGMVRSFPQQIGTHPSSVSSRRTTRLCRNSSLRSGSRRRGVFTSPFFYLATRKQPSVMRLRERWDTAR